MYAACGPHSGASASSLQQVCIDRRGMRRQILRRAVRITFRAFILQGDKSIPLRAGARSSHEVPVGMGVFA